VVFASTLNGKVTFAEPKDIQATFTDYYFYREMSKVFTDAVVAGGETNPGLTRAGKIHHVDVRSGTYRVSDSGSSKTPPSAAGSGHEIGKHRYREGIYV